MTTKRLIDFAVSSNTRKAVPLAGYPAVQLTQSSVKQNIFNAELHARSLYKLVAATRPDMVFTMMDLSVEAGALGLPVRFPLDDTATVEEHPVACINDLNQFKVLDPIYDGRLWVYLEATRILAQKLDVAIGAYVTGPFTLAGLMIGATEIAIASLDNPELVAATLTLCEQVCIQYAKAFEASGADVICVVDPTSVMLSPDLFDQFAGSSVANVVRRLNLPGVLHVCGDTTHLIDRMCRTGVQALSLDTGVDIPAILPRVPPDIVIMGNIDPVGVMLNGSPGDVRDAVFGLLEATSRFPNFILSTGCDLPVDTPIANIASFCDAARDYSCG